MKTMVSSYTTIIILSTLKRYVQIFSPSLQIKTMFFFQVLMALYEKKIPFTTKLVDITKGEQYKPWYLKINPKGEVPVLKDGVKLIPDSVRIIDYLEDNFSNGKYLYGR